MSTVPKDSLSTPPQPPEVDKLRPVTGMGVTNVAPPQQGVQGPPVFPRPRPGKSDKL